MRSPPWPLLLFSIKFLVGGAGAAAEPPSALASDLVPSCPSECFCLSKSEVLCNAGGLAKIPLEQLPASVQQLTLNKNNISQIKTEAFAGLRQLANLSLDHNNITQIKAFAFRGLPRLRTLSIQHTPLAVISSFSFAGLQNIEVIRLAHNRIHKIMGEAFAGTSGVGLLLLDKNPLKVVHSKAFSGLSNVKHLIFPAGVVSLEVDAFNGLDHVGLLRLAFMDLPSLDAHTFRGLRHVHVFQVQDSDLGVIRAQAFEGLSQVLNMVLKNNKIDMMEEFRILQPNKVYNLRLEGNHLLENPEAGAIVLEISGNLTVAKNHFPCDCRVSNVLRSPLANQSVVDFRTHNYCIKPLDVNGVSMASLDARSLARCHDSSARSNTESSSTRGRTRTSFTSSRASSTCASTRGLPVMVGLAWLLAGR